MTKPQPVEAVSRLKTVSKFSSDFLRLRKTERRAVEAAIWGLPIVAFDALRQAFFRAGAKYNDLVYFSKLPDWKFQVPTPNPSSLYAYANFNLKDGPVVVDIPAAAGAVLLGSLNDVWQASLTDVGTDGEDHAKGGKYLLLPPGHRAPVAKDFLPVRAQTHNGYAVFQAVPATTAADDLAKAADLLRRINLYPQDGTHVSRHIDIAGKPFDALVRFDDTFYDTLSRMLHEEMIQTHDLMAMAQFRDFGLERGRSFTPDTSTREILKGAAAEAREWCMQSIAVGASHWTDTHWIVTSPVGPKTGFNFVTTEHFDVDARSSLFFHAFGAPKKPGVAVFHAASHCDAEGARFTGEMTYRLRVPPHVPVSQSWSATVYDLSTAAFIRETPRVAIDSYQNVQRNSDGSVHVYFGPTPPHGRESNWIYTTPGQPWFTFFRFYGPAKAVLDRTWRLPDVERL
jgi:hypothetical protein